ncbi:MAG: histidine kinase dimerization/phospho-acceptor domain-containing protein [bacterium]
MTDATDIDVDLQRHFGVEAKCLENMGLGCFAADRQGNIVFCSPLAQRMLGLKDVMDCGPNGIETMDRVMGLGIAQKWSAILGGEGFFCHRAQCTNLQGHYHTLSLSLQADTSAGTPGQVVIGVVREESDPAADKPGNDIQILAEVAAALSSIQELHHLLKVILTGATASQGLGFNRAFLFLHDEEAGDLVGRMAVGPATPEEAGDIWGSLSADNLSLAELLGDSVDHEQARTDHITQLVLGFRIDLEQSPIIAGVCRDEKGLCLSACDELDPVVTALTERLGTRDLAVVPMISKGNLQGLLVADNYITRQPMTVPSLRLLQILANQAAVALERGRLYESLYMRATEMERINQLLAESQDQMIRIEKMSVIGELTSAVAHELRNPLTIVGGFANLMLRSDLPDEHREYLGIIAAETRRAETVLDHVLDFSKASRGECRQFDFADLLRRNLNLLKGRHRLADNQLQLAVGNESLPVTGNVDQLSHAVFQFINVVVEELIPPSSITIHTKRKDDMALMSVEVRCDLNRREDVNHVLQRIFAESPASQRLSVIVAGETVRYHGGNCGLAVGAGGDTSVYMELPLNKESQSE